MFAILMALPLLHVKQTAPATHPCSRRPTRTGLSKGRRLPCSIMQEDLVDPARRPPALRRRPALGIALLTDSTVGSNQKEPSKSRRAT